MTCVLGTAAAGNIKMDYCRFGSGSGQMVIIPGLSVQSVLLFKEAIEKQYKVFTSDYDVYVFDRRQDIPEGYTVADMAEDTASAMKSLGIRDACIFGASQGGMITMLIAAEHPELVSAIALGSTSAHLSDEAEDSLKKWADLAAAGDRLNLYMEFAVRVYNPEMFEQFKGALAVMSEKVSDEELERFRRLTVGTAGLDIRDKLSSIKCPALVIGDMTDMVLGGDASVEIYEILKDKGNSELYMYDGFGHAAYDAAPDYTDRLYSFFNRAIISR
ncbi:MAG: alpha/beta hydrolase [Clostridiales bacterium]|nr:alpha/beta hydrolase [Clostridiales bacterium]